MSLNILAKTHAVATKGTSNGTYPGAPITEIITNGLFTVDHQWTVLNWNVAAEKLLEVKAIDIVGKNLWEQFAATLPVNFYSSYHKAFLQDIPVHFEEYWAERNTWFDVITYHFDNMLSVSFKSSHQQMDTERSGPPAQQLKILTELYRFVTEITNDCLWEWDLQTDELFWIDGGHKRVFGYPVQNALVPMAFWKSRVHPEDLVRILEKLKETIGLGTMTVWEDEYRFQRVNGEYADVHDRAHIIYNEHRIATRMIGATQDITVRKTTERELLASQQQLILLARENAIEVTRAVLAAQEKERANIGKDLHDNLNQVLGAAKMYIEMAKTDEKNRILCLDKSSEYIVKVIEGIRNISKTLVTPVMIMGLAGSIRIVVDDLMAAGRLEITFEQKGIDEKLLGELLQLNIFRIIQEQLNNIVRHAHATHVTIHLTQHSNNITLRISDNGIGYDMRHNSNGFGIVNIRNRAELFGGRVTVASSPGKGFRLKVVLSIPRSVEKKDLSAQHRK